MGTKQMTLLEKVPTRVPGQNLLKAELPCMGMFSPSSGTPLGSPFPAVAPAGMAVPGTRGQNSHLRGSRQLGRQWMVGNVRLSCGRCIGSSAK